MASVKARLGSRKYLAEMRALANLLSDSLSYGIPGYSPINPVQFSEKFGHSSDAAAIYELIKCQRTPTIEKAVRLGILLQRAGCEIGVYDLLLKAADGIYSKICNEMHLDKSELSDPSSGIDTAPQEVSIAPTAIYSVSVYESLTYEDRITAAESLLQSIARDIRFYKMTDDLEVVQELVREASERRGSSPKVLAEVSDVPLEWVEDIIKGDWEKVWSESDSRLLISLSSKVKDLDGNLGHYEFFVPLMGEAGRKGYLREVRKRKNS